MIDRAARDQAVSLLRSVFAEGVTNWKLEDAWPRSDSDPALGCILRWLWSLYDDDTECQMTDVIGEEMLPILNRAIAFLEGNYSYGLANLSETETANAIRTWGREWNPRCRSPDYPEWPFPPGFDLSSIDPHAG